MRTARRLLALALVVGGAVVVYRFVQANETEVPVHLVAVELGPVPVSLALAVAFAAGLVLGAGGLLYSAARNALTARRYRKALEALERELHELRSLPLADEEGGAGGSRPPAGGGRRAARGSG